MTCQYPMFDQLKSEVRSAIHEDLGCSDITATLIPANDHLETTIISRESAILCGVNWVHEVYLQIDPKVKVIHAKNDGDGVAINETIFKVSGPARSVLSGERISLNFLQTLSAIATKTAKYVRTIAGTKAKIFDTRKTIPGLRNSSKYAVTKGGGNNHRMGLYDAILIKENHISAAGGIAGVLQATKLISKTVSVQIEVETIEQLEESLRNGAELLLLDNFSLKGLIECVRANKGRAILEASGNIDIKNIREVALTGVDRISVGDLTKNIKAIDFSMRI